MPIKRITSRPSSNLKRSLSASTPFENTVYKKIFKRQPVPVIEVENPQFDVHDYVGIESGKESYVSFPANRINIPEVKEATGNFVYNYFVKDERVRIVNSTKDKVLDLQTDFSNEIFFQLANDKLPRYVRLDFRPPKTYGIIKKSNVSKLIENNLDKLTIEGASSNKYYTGIEFIDTGKEDQIYSMLNGAAFVHNIQPKGGSKSDAADLLFDTLEETGGVLHGKDKKLLKEAMANMQSAGYTLAQSDVSPELGNFSSDAISMQSFSVQFSNLCMSEAVQSAVRMPDTVFQDEMNGLSPFSSKLKRKILKTINPSRIDDADYEMVCKAVKIRTINNKTMYPNRITFQGPRIDPSSTGKSSSMIFKSLYDKYPKIKIAGYIIGKYEVLANGATEHIGNLYSDNPDGLYIVDKDVRYGGNYVYKIRTICEVETVVRTTVSGEDKESLSSFAVATVLVASEGRTVGVNCTEDTPPPPPENLRVSFNYRQKLPFLSWQFPFNPQRDIKRFQIFKRLSLDEPFTLIGEYDFDNSVIRGSVAEVATPENLIRLNAPRVNFLDTTFTPGQEPIYTIAAVDAHGMSSNYGAQISVKYSKYLNKIVTKLVSVPNAPKPYPNLLVNVDAFQDAIRISGYNRMKVFFTPEYYKVYKNEIRKGAAEKIFKREISTEFLRVNPNLDTYQIHLLNIDLQKDEIVNIRIKDASGTPLNTASPANFSVKNLSFEFGV